MEKEVVGEKSKLEEQLSKAAEVETPSANFFEKKDEILNDKKLCPFHIDPKTYLPKEVEMIKIIGNYLHCPECSYGVYI